MERITLEDFAKRLGKEISNEKETNDMVDKVYKHTFPNGKVYIGITSKTNVKDRWGEDGKYYKGQFVYRAIKKYGWQNIVHEVLFKNLTKEEAEQREIELIAFYRSNQQNFGYNVQNGGNIKGPVSDTTLQKISIASKNIPINF